MSQKRTKKEKYGYNYIQFTVSEDFKTQIENAAKDCGFKTNSDFIRAAIREKIDKLENPNQSVNLSNTLNPELIRQISKNTKKALELEQKILQRLKTFNEIKNDLELVKKHSVVKDLKIETNKIVNLLKAHNSLKINKIAEKTNVEESIVLKIISSRDDLFELDIKSGGFKLI